MIYLLLIVSIFIPSMDKNTEINKLKLLEEKIFQFEKYIKKNKNKIKCNLAFGYQNQNYFRESSKYLKYCKKLGPKYRELYSFMEIRERFYLNKKGLLYKINSFLKKYKNSVFLEEVEKFKLRYYFKNENYRKSYYNYLNYKKEKKTSHEELLFINYIIRYSYLKIAKKNDKLIALLDILQDKQFYIKENIDSVKEEIKKYTIKEIEGFIKIYLKEKKYYKISKLLYLSRRFDSELFKKIIEDEKIKKELKMKETNLNYEINIYHFNKKSWDFNKKEDFLNNLLKLTKKEKKDILYQKLVLYKRHHKTEKRIATYKKMLEFNQTRRKKAYYYLKIGVYSLDIGNKKEGLKYLHLILSKYNRWYKEYPSALFTLFKIYREQLLEQRNNNSLTTKEKAINITNLQKIEKKMEKTYLKQISYYYKYKDNRFKKDEREKIIEYFEKRPYNFYTLMINKKIIDQENSWKSWEELTKYQKIPDSYKNTEKILNKKYSLYQIKKIFKKYENSFTEINILKNLSYIEENDLSEKIMINFYNKLYKLNKIRNKKNINENEKKLTDILKEIKKNYYYHFLNYFISINNIQYSYLLMHRHFHHLKNDDFYKFYYSPIPYPEIIDKEAKKFNINPLIIISIMETESIFNSNAYSSAGAIGLMQIMPATGRSIAKELNIKNYDLYLPKYNIKFGTYYLSELLKRFHYQLPFSAASYNGGPHNMKRWLGKNKNKNLKLDEMIERIGFRESRKYAKKIIRLFSTYRNIYFNTETIIPINVNFNDKKSIGF